MSGTKTATKGRKTWMRYEEAEVYSRLNRAKLQEMVTSGVLPHVKHGRVVIIDADDLDKLMVEMKQTRVKEQA